MRKFVMSHDLARQRAIDAVKSAPAGYVVTVKEPTRNLDANAALHARLTEVAKSREWVGKRQDVETWKRLFTAAWMRATGRTVTMLPALDGAGVDVVYSPTSRMTQSEVSELITWIDAWDAEQEQAA